MRTREEQREELRRYEGDVFYDVWRNGGNPDRLDMDRVSDDYYNHVPVENVVRDELHRQRPRPDVDQQEEPGA